VSTDWTPAERRAWRWPDRLKPSEWAEQNRILPAHVTAEPGPWRNERTPYLAGIMDAVAEPGVETIVVPKAAQVGFSEAIRNCLGFFIDHDPGPALMVMPDQKSAEELITERVRPLLEYTPAVARHVTSRAWDVKKSSIRLTTMSIYVGWAGSSQALKSRPIRWLFLDEPDEYIKVSGHAGDPISKATKRITTYSAKGRARVLMGGTPTTTDNNVWKYWLACGDRRHFWVPCPHCGKYQRLIWGSIGEGPGVKWTRPAEPDRSRRAAQIESDDLAYYQCETGCKITHEQKLIILPKGVWAGEDQVVTPDGRVAGPVRRHKMVGFHLPAMYSPWVTFSKMAAEFVAAKHDAAAMADFINQRLAEPFEVLVSRREPNHIRQKASGAGPERVVPSWAVLLIATCDVQKDHVYYAVTAWGYEMQSKRVAIGVAATLDEMYRAVFQPSFPFVMDTGVPIGVQKLVIDSGYRKDEVTEFCRRDPARCEMAKGLSTYFGPIADPKVEKASGVMVWNINTMQSKDTLDRLIKDPDAEKWQVFEGISDEYCAHLASEHKTIDPQTKQMVWKEKSSGAANHWLDCEAMACAVARAQGADAPKPVKEAPRAERSGQQEIPADDFMQRGRKRW
jgi:phage terminase large subunit GpA-like protein